MKSGLAGEIKQATAGIWKGIFGQNPSTDEKIYVMFPIANALRSQLTWTHYQALLRVKNEETRQWYMNEAKQVFASKV